jgi:glucose-1-phosphate adenylyltransferase
MDGTLAVILAGGRGTRLGPLTAETPKPLLPFAGRYRLIDFAFSNCINSGVSALLVITGHLAGPVAAYVGKLRRLLPDAWQRRVVVSASPRDGPRVAGTAAAVHSALPLVRRLAPRNVLVLASDHVYSMDYAAIVDRHRAAGAGVTVGSVLVPGEDAHRFGVLATDRDGRIESFEEKPRGPARRADGRARVSMGIYVFDREVLASSLAADATDPGSSRDFGRDLIPALVRSRRAWAHPFEGYWRDLGTVDAYFRAHRDLLVPRRRIPFVDPYWPVLSAAWPALPHRVDVDRRGTLRCHGSFCEAGSRVRSSVICPTARVGRGASVEDCIVLDGARIGEGARLRGVIVGEGETVRPRARLRSGSAPGDECLLVSSGRVVRVEPPAEAPLGVG